MPRVLVDTDATLRSVWPRGGTVTVGVTDLLGNLITPSATEATTDDDDGIFTYSFPAARQVDYGQITWIEGGDQEQHDVLEVVGTHLFSELEARAFKNAALKDTVKYLPDAIAVDRDRITDQLETVTGRSWVSRYRLMMFRGSGSRNLYLADFVRSLGGGPGDGALRDTIAVLSATDQNGDISPDNIVIADSGLLIRTDGVWLVPDAAHPVNITLEIEYGAGGEHEGADWAAQEILVDRLRNSNIPDRAITWTDEFGNVRFDVLPTQARDWIRNHDYRIKAF